MKWLSSLLAKARREYLAKQFTRPGRSRLFANGSEEYGPTLNQLASYTSPLIFEDEAIEEAPYGTAGTYFLARYRSKMFAITAQHCLSQEGGDDVRLALNPETNAFLPLRNLHRPISNPPNQDFADIAIFEAAPELVDADARNFLHAVALDPLKVSKLEIKNDARLVVAGYPKCLNEIDYDKCVIHNQRFVASGKYRGHTDRRGIHALDFDDLDQITWPDGMSGSPVFFVEAHPEAHFFGFLGMLIKAHRYSTKAEFIGADIIFRFLDNIIDAQATGT